MKRFFSYLGRFLYHLLVILNKRKEQLDQHPCTTDQEVNVIIEGDEFSMELSITDSIKNRVTNKVSGEKRITTQTNGAGEFTAPINREQAKEAKVNESNKQ